MSNKLNLKTNFNKPMLYQIKIEGQLGHQWAGWFEGMTIMPKNGDTLITGPVIDQAALYSLLRKVRDLGMPLLSVVRLQYKKEKTL